jgi:hypothetical protein
MITLYAIAPGGTRERFRFETQAEADAAADQHREAGHSLYWIVWAESLQRWVTGWQHHTIRGAISGDGAVAETIEPELAHAAGTGPDRLGHPNHDRAALPPVTRGSSRH